MLLIRFLTWVVAIWFVIKLFKGAIKGFFYSHIRSNDHIRNMQDQLNNLNNKVNQKQSRHAKIDGEYIDYEDVK